MECKEDSQRDIFPSERMISKTFIFSEPYVLRAPRPVNSGINFEQISDAANIRRNWFTFAMPISARQSNNQDVSTFQPDTYEKPYKPKISRNYYNPAVNVFAQALKDTAMFEQSKRNRRSQVIEINSENSITCTNVPKTLLAKGTAKRYFVQFGHLSKITIRPRKRTIIVIYAAKQDAKIACSKSGEYLGEKFNVERTKLSVPPKSPTKKRDLQKNGIYDVSQIVSNFLKSSDDEIKSELDAMTNLEYNLHSRNNFDETLTKRRKILQSKSTSKSFTRMKKTSAKAEKLKAESQISDLLPSATIEELQNIIQQPAYTSEDKYKVLEARDRLIRIRQTKSHTLAAVKVMIGTCPDMCPEKERLMRESKRQVASYEQLEINEYRINHMVAVKQYSRSSADQEEPMAHELRPVKSLKMTMSYLLHEIVNLCDQQGTNLGEWYHFLWDRTRGIRKDITQQELCCIDSVELVEQCARFHIVCSERLCAEQPSVFDKKINSDNLTKCLQSLKYMYHDLRVKEITCKNEPEFRAYIILLNLNNGNFMWDLQRLPNNIQKSSEVQFALDIYSALESNNYYKFFKLVQETTYLNACILLRYFYQVRLKALSALVKAYCRTASTAYPLYELIDILGFEDENEAIYFCEQVGLNVSEDGSHVLLNRHNFTMPVSHIKQKRACNLIDSKRTMQHLSIGECIAGGRMPEKVYKYHKPHNSFDSRGYLMPDSINAEDQNKSIVSSSTDPYEFIDEDIMHTEQSISMSEKRQNNNENVLTTEHAITLKTVSTTEANTNLLTMKSNANTSCVSKSQTQMNKFQINTNSELITSKIGNQKDSRIFSFVSAQQSNESSILSNVSNVTPTTCKTSNLFSKQFEPSPSNNDIATVTNKSIFSGMSRGNIYMKNPTSSTVFSSTYSNLQTISKSPNIVNTVTLMGKTIPNETSNFLVKSQVPQEEKTEKLKLEEQESIERTQEINDIAKDILNTLETELVQAHCSAIVKEETDKIYIYNTFSEDISNEIFNEVTSEICDNLLQKEIVNARKLNEISMKIKNRVIVKCFNKWRFNALKKKQQRTALENTPVWLQRHTTEQCAKLLYTTEQDLVIRSMCKKYNEIRDIKYYPEPLAPITAIIHIGIKEHLKSLNIDIHPNCYWKLIISWPNLHNKTVLWHCKKIMNQYLCPEDYSADPIIKLYQPNQSETLHICIRHFEGLISDHHLTGSDALLFTADASEEIKFIIKRLTKIVLSRDRLMPIPLVFLILGDSTFQTQDKEIISTLEQFLKSGYLSVYKIVHEKNLDEKAILNLTQNTILWLSVNKSPQNPLEMDYLQNIYNTCLTDDLWLRIYDNSFFNEKLLHALEKPKFIIDLHNEAVSHVIDIILDPESFMYTKFAPEFKKFVKNQYMMPCSYEHFDDVWKSEEYKAKLERVMSSFKLPQWRYPWPINNSIIFRQYITNYCQEALFTSDSDEISDDILSNLFVTTGIPTTSNFIDVLLYIIKRKIYLLAKDLKVIYNKNCMKCFRTLPWWLKSNLLTEYKIVSRNINVEETEKENKTAIDINEPTMMVKKRKLNKFQENKYELEPLATFCENSRSQVMEVHNISRKIENRLKEHQEQSYLFEEKLKNAFLNV
ncbi:uncharacterized protein LOC122565826 [Bombus pyrosoma]|uniref:uncharacterized protein LOC122565826 n=1 Tax=Bombus pyrosoma TaxID=396416 RepID=UPI001CB8E1FD|nr:uncharacterized protein LOC122565826 [Bombus pyrosoma]